MSRFRVCLVNMPFAALSNPSLALTQLSSVLSDALGDRVSVEIHYLNQDFARAIGREVYDRIATSFETQNCGLGDWFFRQAAFPDQTDNAEEYFGRYFPHGAERSGALKRDVLRCRERTEDLLSVLMEERGLHRAQLVGFTSMFFQNVASLAMARLIKERNPGIVIAMGGANCETPMGEEIARHAGQIDFVFSGPGLKSFPRLVRHLVAGDRNGCNGIDGVFSATSWSAAGPSSSMGEELQIDQKIDLDYDDFLEELDEKFPGGEISPHLLFETSRGCWWGERSQCTFCGLNGTTMAHRAMRPERALQQFEELFRYYPRCLYFESVDNLLPKGYVEEVFPNLDTPLDATIFYEVKANLSAKELEVMAHAGVRRVQPGIESLATSTLKLMKKGATAFHNLRFLKNCIRYGIEPMWNLLVGFPGEGEEVYEKYVEDLPLLTHLFPPSGVYPVRFDRFSRYFVEAERYGLDLHPFDFYGLVYPFPEESLSNLAYYFMDHRFDAEYMAVMVRWLERVRKPVDEWSRRWSGRDGIAPPRLCFKRGEPTVVLDSRGSGVEEHDVGENGAAVLERLEEPRGIARLASELGHLPGFDADREVGALFEQGLLFREQSRFLSLITRPQWEQAEGRVPGFPEARGGGGEREPELIKLGRDAYRRRRSELTGSAGSQEEEQS